MQAPLDERAVAAVSGVDVEAPSHDLDVVVVAAPGDIATVVAELVAHSAFAAVAARGRFLFALSGGSTPAPLYELLAGPRFDHLPWDRTHLLWGDERCVAPDDERSNYALAARSGLLDRPLAGVRRMRGEDRPEQAAVEYEQVLAGLLERAAPPAVGDPGTGLAVDLALLGLGDDGHTASLFPASSALSERGRAVVSTEEHAGSRRLTLTLPMLWAARRVAFLVAGAAKQAAVRRVLQERDSAAPATLVLARARRVTWVMDSAAAGGGPARC